MTIDRAPGAYLRKGYRREWMNWRLWLSKKRIIWKKRIKNNKNLQRQISSQNREGSVFSFAIFEKIMYNRKISGLKADRREERWVYGYSIVSDSKSNIVPENDSIDGDTPDEQSGTE